MMKITRRQLRKLIKENIDAQSAGTPLNASSGLDQLASAPNGSTVTIPFDTTGGDTGGDTGRGSVGVSTYKKSGGSWMAVSSNGELMGLKMSPDSLWRKIVAGAQKGISDIANAKIHSPATS
jgi:hypothetical protein